MCRAETVFQGDYLRATGTGLDRAEVFVTFDHRQKDKQSFEDYAPFERALRRGAGHLAIGTTANDWFLNPDTVQLGSALRAASTRWKTRAIGFSMGGYGAMLFAADLRLEQMILFAPQYSIFPAHAPHDPRYASYAEAIEAELDVIPQVSGCGPAGMIFYDPRLQPVDRLHADLICDHFPALRRAALPFGGHPPLNNFDKRNGYGKIADAFVAGALDAAFVRGLHRAARPGSDRYQRHLARYLEQRRNRSG